MLFMQKGEDSKMSEKYDYILIRRLDFALKRRDFEWGMFQKRLNELGKSGYRLIDRFTEEGDWVMLFSKTLRTYPYNPSKRRE